MPSIFRIGFKLSKDFNHATNIGLGEIGMTLSKYGVTAKSTTQMIKGAVFDDKNCDTDQNNNCDLIEQNKGFLDKIIDQSAEKNGYNDIFYVHKNDKLFLLDTPEHKQLADELKEFVDQGLLSEVTVFPTVFDESFQPWIVQNKGNDTGLKWQKADET